jgi:NarL family two-component system response regulator LiaR
VQATRHIRQISPHTQVVVLTSFAEDELIFAAIKAGALSYLLKDADAETVLNAIFAAY